MFIPKVPRIRRGGRVEGGERNEKRIKMCYIHDVTFTRFVIIMYCKLVLIRNKN